MELKYRIPAVLAGAVAAAIAFAPGAAADDLDDTPGASRSQASSQQEDSAPKGWSNEALWADDGPGASKIFGTLPKPPIYALD